MPKLNTSILAGTLFGLLATQLGGCFHDEGSSSVTTRKYEVTVTNLSNNQPLSPLALILHKSGYSGWEAGAAVTTGLEKLAEGGDNGDFLDEAAVNTHVLDDTSGAGLILPGQSETVMLSTTESSGVLLTLATMLVNTNDAFSGVSSQALSSLANGESLHMYAHTYDAGTEANSETAATIPGPAGGGEGYNAMRDDLGKLTVHGGVVTADDGLATSTLDESHRFLGPVSMITVMRTQ